MAYFRVLLKHSTGRMGKFTEKLSQSTQSSGPKEEESNKTSRKKTMKIRVCNLHNIVNWAKYQDN
jgi:hypothetical protein